MMLRQVKQSVLWIAMALLTGMILWQVRDYQLLSKVDAYLPKDLYVAVGATYEIANEQIVGTDASKNYILQWDCAVGHSMETSYLVEGNEVEIGEYPLTITIFEPGGRKIGTLNSTLHIVQNQMEGNYSICNIGKDLWYGIEWTPMVSGFSGGHISFTETIPEMGKILDWNDCKLEFGIDPDAVQIVLGSDEWGAEPKEVAAVLEKTVNEIRRYDQILPIYIVNQPYDRENQQRVIDLAQALDRKLGNYTHVKIVQQAVYSEADAGLSFAANLYNVYCGTLELMLE